jgi:hypothetical protein
MKSIRTTPQQRAALSLLKSRFAELGYEIFPVARWYRKHHLDFIAMPKTMPQFFVFAHPLRNGSISVRPFCRSMSDTALRRVLSQLKVDCPIRWKNQQLRLARTQPDWWHAYLTPQAEKEYMRLKGVDPGTHPKRPKKY